MNDMPDKEILHGEFLRGERWRERFARKLAHKGADLVDDDMNVTNQTSTQSGLGWKELAVIGGLALGGGHLLLPLLNLRSEIPKSQVANPADSEYEVRFFDKDGNAISVPHKSQVSTVER